jgi:hypothetical protein
MNFLKVILSTPRPEGRGLPSIPCLSAGPEPSHGTGQARIPPGRDGIRSGQIHRYGFLWMVC